MQFLKILFWCLLAFIAALFTYSNWNTVPLHLWGGLIADVNLPLLLLLTFLCGLLPAMALGQLRRWRLRQRLALAEQELAQARVALVSLPVPPPVMTEPPAPAAPAPPPATAMASPPPVLDVPPEPA